MTRAWRRPLGLAALLAGCLGAVAPARAEISDVLREIERRGDARVIVVMRTGTDGAGWEQAKSVAQQRAVVADAASRVERSLGAASIPVEARFKTLPFLGARVTRDQLLSLAANSDIAAVHLVRIERKLPEPAERAAASEIEHAALANSVPSIDVPAAWAAGFDGKGLNVAVIDGGFNLAHPMLQGKAVAEACFGDTSGTLTANCPSGSTPQIAAGAASNCPTGSTRCMHGTHVASIAVGNDGTNFGVARGAGLLPIDVFSKDSDPTDCSPDPTPCEVTDSLAVLNALDFVNDHSTDYSIAAVNMSLGGATYSGYCDDDPRKSVIDMLRAKGIAVTVSAGNDGATGQIEKPACISSAIAVGATDNTTTVASFSDFATTLSLMAPGVRISAASGTGSGLIAMSGTSMAAPHVAGAWTLLRAAVPKGTANQFLDALKVTGDPVTRQDSGITVARIRVMHAIDHLNGRDRKFFNQIVSSSGVARGTAYLRVYNASAAAGTLVATLRDVSTGTVLGTWKSPAIPAHASPQFAISRLEAEAVPATGQTVVSAQRLAYDIELESSFSGYVQSLLWGSSAGLFANMTSCSNGLAATDATLAINVHASSLTDYVSRLRIANTGPVAATPVLTFVDASTGNQVGSWTSASIPPGGAVEVAEPDLEAAVPALAAATTAGTSQYNVQLGAVSGYLQHVIENKRVAAFTDMSGKCALTASSAVPAPTTTTASK